MRRVMVPLDGSDIVTHGRSGLSRVVLGSVADGLVHKAHIPIVAIPTLALTKSVSVAVDRTPAGMS